MADYTERLKLVLPHEDDIYDIDEFNKNNRILDKEIVRVPKSSKAETIDQFIESGESTGYRRGDTVIVNHIMYIMVGDNPKIKDSFMAYGPEALVVMRHYLVPEERIKGSLYLQLTQTRKLIIKVFKKYLGSLPSLGEIHCLYFNKTNIKTALSNDRNTYRFTCKNISVLDQNAGQVRTIGKLYINPDRE